MGSYGRGIDPAFWLLAGLFWLVLLGMIIWAVLRLVPGRGGQAQGATPVRHNPEVPEEILDRRFARGEVDLETYQAQRSALAAVRGGKP